MSISPLQAFSLGADFVHLSKRGLPVAPDGEYDYENQANPGANPRAHSSVTNLIESVGFAEIWLSQRSLTVLQLEAIKPKGAVKPNPRVVVRRLSL
jgi:hypothetical protein